MSNLLDTIQFKGDLAGLVLCEPSQHWLATFPSSPLPAKYHGLQAGVLDILRVRESCYNLAATLSIKIKVTLGYDPFLGVAGLQHSWFPALKACLINVGLFIRVCWLKTFIGGWTTSDRLQLDDRWNCIYGCTDCLDEIRHYLICLVLWQFGRETLKIRESSISIEERLCLVNPSIEKLKLSAFCHCLYHATRKDSVCIVNDAPASASVVQFRALALAQHAKFLVSEH